VEVFILLGKYSITVASSSLTAIPPLAPVYSTCASTHAFFPPRSVDPNAFGDPYAPGGRPGSILSTSTNGVDSAWRRRQTIKRGVTRKVKLTNGNFITEYPVPTPVYTAIESKWSSTKTNEFS
jgi:chitin synthase